MRVSLLILIAIVCGVRPAVAQIDFDIAGFWDQPALGTVLGPGNAAIFGFEEDSTERADGPTLVDYLGIPLNDEGRARALAYDSALLGVPEHVCMRHPSQYSYWGPARLRIASQLDANLDVVSYTVGGTFRRADRTVWMDGRPHPSTHAPHTWAGFTTGEWRGSTLVTTTTHLKWGWIRRNGVPSSDQATVVTYYTRNENVLTIAWIVYDPLYLTEPYIKSADFIAAPRGVTAASFDVEPADRTNNFFGLCFPREEIARPDPHYVPHYLPDANPFVGELATKLRIPVEATLGGAQTAYPEYRETLRQGAAPDRRRPPTTGSSVAQPARIGRPLDNTLDVLKVQGNVWMIAGAGGNIAVQAGDQGVIVVDTGAGTMNDAVIAAIRRISTKPIRYVINTSASAQHVGGNAALASLPGGSTTGGQRGALVSVIAQENVYSRMSRSDGNGATPFPAVAWPSDGYYVPRRGLTFNGEAIDIVHMPNASTDGDSIVYFRGSNVLVTGDLFTTTNLPMVDRTQGGSYAGLLGALNALLDIAVPDDLMEGGTYIIPGHGRICDEADLVEYRDMVHEVRDRLKKMITDGSMTAAQVKAAKPVLGWEARYMQPEWTTEMFIDAVYPEFAPRTPARPGATRGTLR